MFVMYLGVIFTTIITIYSFTGFIHPNHHMAMVYGLLPTLRARLPKHGFGKAQAQTLKKTQTETFAKKLVDNKVITVPATDLKKGDKILCSIRRYHFRRR